MPEPSTLPYSTLPPNPNPADIFIGHLPLAWKLAGKFSRFYGLPYDDVKDEAEGALGLICADYHTERARKPETATRRYASTITWVYRKLYFHLLTYATRKQSKETNFTTMGGDSETDFSDNRAAPQRWIDRLLMSIGRDAKVIVETILFGPAELLDELMPSRVKEEDRIAPPETARAAVASMIDWEDDRFKAAWTEIEQAL